MGAWLPVRWKRGKAVKGTDLWCETLGIPPDAGSLLRLPPLLDGLTAPQWGCAPAKTRGQHPASGGIPSVKRLQAAPTDWPGSQQPAPQGARSRR
eukprot:6860455-Prymnesium_polylepis.1